MMHSHTTFKAAQGQGSARVTFEGRIFYVKIGEDGKPLHIKERRLFHKGTVLECWGNATYWHHSHKIPGPGRGFRRKSIVRTLLEVAGVDPRHIAGH